VTSPAVARAAAAAATAAAAAVAPPRLQKPARRASALAASAIGGAWAHRRSREPTCAIYTHHPGHSSGCAATKATWVAGCDQLLFVSDRHDPPLPARCLAHDGEEGRSAAALPNTLSIGASGIVLRQPCCPSAALRSAASAPPCLAPVQATPHLALTL
jgi:hypothetical protein